MSFVHMFITLRDRNNFTGEFLLLLYLNFFFKLFSHMIVITDNLLTGTK